MPKLIIPQEIIQNKIFLIRGKKVMFDKDLAELYGVKTEQLTRQVRRNLERFPEDFLLRLTREEFENLNCHFGSSSWGGTRKPPFAFTEHGILMLSSVLGSSRAVQVNIAITRAFVKLREILSSNKALAHKFSELERRVGDHDAAIRDIIIAIRKMLSAPAPKKPKGPIGFQS